MSLRAAGAIAGSCIETMLRPDAEVFRNQWVYVDATADSPLLLISSAPMEPSSGWGHAKLVDHCLARVWTRLTRLQKLGVMAPMVVQEFIRWCIAPLQRHSRPMWAFTGIKDCRCQNRRNSGRGSYTR